MALLRDFHDALARKDADQINTLGRRILDSDPRYPQSIVDYVQGVFSGRLGGRPAVNVGFPERLGDLAASAAEEAPKGTDHEPTPGDAGMLGDQRVGDDIACISGSGLFDRKWYRAKYLANVPGGIDEILHYCQDGWRRGCNPSENFSTNYYLAANPDIKAAGCNPLTHYINQGRHEGRVCVPVTFGDVSDTQKEVDAQYVSWHKQRLDFVSTPHQAIAFYLPQFHAIPENDEWWGEGFTEWTNVRPAKPLFPGHHQPHEPGEFGYYDLSSVQTIRRQVRIAKNYLVDGFCFYFYWFNGKTLLEKPIQLFNWHHDIEFQYCLCWANENWTRRWDGKDEDVLMSQSHSPEDDLAFIQHIAKYLQDARYIRFDDKPLLIVYRPSLLPDPSATAGRWRERCRELGIGEIYLATTQAFETTDPRSYGFDGSVEFAPNNMSPPCITHSVEGLEKDFQGQIYDWRGLVRRSEAYPRADFPVHRCVNPGWDNTARRKLRSSILLNSSPREFQHWTVNAITDETDHFGDDGLIFVNAWNEWAEGAHLEPCQKYGYAYLEAFRQARIRAGVRRALQNNVGGHRKSSRVAVVVHAFYPEVLSEIFEMLRAIPAMERPEVIITTPYSKVEECARESDRFGLDVDPLIIGVENRGRDILPFFTAFEYLARGGYRIFCKLHTKRSLHREDGKIWRQRMFESLLDSDRVPEILKRLSGDSRTGIIAPEDHLLPMSAYWGSNRRATLGLAARLGVEAKTVMTLPLVAGSMFWARTEALLPLYALVDSADFEGENGQTDGTMAHAIERLFSVSAYSVGLDVRDSAMKPFDYTDDSEFAFANKG